MIQMISGAIGGNILAKVTRFTLGPIYNSIVGAVGGAIGGFIFQTVGVGAELTSYDSLGITSMLLQVAISAVSGAILTMFADLLRTH
jgi:hypothetical protein